MESEMLMFIVKIFFVLVAIFLIVFVAIQLSGTGGIFGITGRNLCAQVSHFIGGWFQYLCNV